MKRAGRGLVGRLDHERAVELRHARAAHEDAEVAHPVEHVLLEVEPGGRLELLLDRVPAAGHAGEGVDVEVEQLPEVVLASASHESAGSSLEQVAALAEERRTTRRAPPGRCASNDHAVVVGVDGRHDRLLEELLERVRQRRAALAARAVEQLRRVDVEEAEPVVGRVVEGVLVVLVVGQLRAALARVDGGLDAGLGAEHEEAVEHRAGLVGVVGEVARRPCSSCFVSLPSADFSSASRALSSSSVAISPAALSSSPFWPMPATKNAASSPSQGSMSSLKLIGASDSRRPFSIRSFSLSPAWPPPGNLDRIESIACFWSPSGLRSASP